MVQLCIHYINLYKTFKSRRKIKLTFYAVMNGTVYLPRCVKIRRCVCSAELVLWPCSRCGWGAKTPCKCIKKKKSMPFLGGWYLKDTKLDQLDPKIRAEQLEGKDLKIIRNKKGRLWSGIWEWPYRDYAYIETDLSPQYRDKSVSIYV